MSSKLSHNNDLDSKSNTAKSNKKLNGAPSNDQLLTEADAIMIEDNFTEVAPESESMNPVSRENISQQKSLQQQ